MGERDQSKCYDVRAASIPECLEEKAYKNSSMFCSTCAITVIYSHSTIKQIQDIIIRFAQNSTFETEKPNVNFVNERSMLVRLFQFNCTKALTTEEDSGRVSLIMQGH